MAMSDDENDFRPSFEGTTGLGSRHSTFNARDASESGDERPSLGTNGGLRFRPPTAFTQGIAPDTEMLDLNRNISDQDASPPPAKRMRFSNGGGDGVEVRKRNSMPGAPGVKGGLAARLMAKMGYKEGEGLGKDGRGRLAAIDAKLRPQRAGLGAVREKSDQAKEEEKRAAKLRGEAPEEDSEDEEKARRQDARRKRQEGNFSGAGSGKTSQAHRKTKYKTAAEIEEESGGLEVPSVMKKIIDLTGKETDLPLLGGRGSVVPQETEVMKIARRARRDLEVFAEEWTNAKEQRRYLEMENEQLVTELDQEDEAGKHVRAIVEAVAGIEQLSLVSTASAVNATDEQWEAVTKKLEDIEVEFRNDLGKYGIHEVAVAAIQPLFKSSMLNWEPMVQPEYLVAYLSRLQHVLGADVSRSLPTSSAMITADAGDDLPIRRPLKRSTSHYETLLHLYWLPQVRSALVNDWDVHEPEAAIALLQAWRPLLPEFILAHIVRQLILPRLQAAISDWKPSRKTREQPARSTPFHHWLLQWLEYLPPSHLDPDRESGLAVSLKRKIRSILSRHYVQDGPPSWLLPLRSPMFPKHTLTQIVTASLLPQLSSYLRTHFVIEPSDQRTTAFELVLSYRELYSSTAFAELLVARVFPLFHYALRQWLLETNPTDNASQTYSEIARWFEWWKGTLIPLEMRTLPAIEAQWLAALHMMHEALQLGGSRVRQSLPPVKAFLPISYKEEDAEQRRREKKRSNDRDRHRNRSRSPAALAREKQWKRVAPPPQETTFRDVFDDFCAANGLLVLSLREAHPTNGAPLIRVTASSTGKGGVVGYIHGVGFFARKRDADSEVAWKRVGFDEMLQLAKE